MTSSVQPSPRKASHFDEDNLRQHPSRKDPNTRPIRQQSLSTSPNRHQSVTNSPARQKSISNDPARKPSNQANPSARKAPNQSPVRQESIATRRESTVNEAVAEQSRRESRYRRESRMESILGASRRMSMWRRFGGRGTGSHLTDMSQGVRYQNSYQLGPNEDKEFNAKKVELMLHDVLESILSSEVYDVRQASSLAKLCAETLKDRVKELAYPRYKYVSTVTVGQLTGQGLRVASRCLWMTDTDRMATVQYTNATMVAVATVYAVYCE